MDLLYDGLSEIPLVIAFGVKDNGIIAGNDLHYNWSLECTCGKIESLKPEQINHIMSFNPLFFDGIFVKSPTLDLRLIDSPSHYTRFVEYFQNQNQNTLIGSYISATICVKGLTHPHTESYYPQSLVDAYRLDSRGPDTMGTPPHLPKCKSNPGRWLINVAAPGVTNRFCAEVVRIVNETNPKPAFIYLDNVQYIQNEQWADGKIAIDCRETNIAQKQGCKDFREAQVSQFGPNIYFDDLISHYQALITALQDEGVRSILNVNAPAMAMSYPRELGSYGGKLETLIETNGLSFEQPFHPNPRTVPRQTFYEIEAHRRFLSQGKLVLFYAAYTDPGASNWMAAMAMLIKNPGQSLFLSRSASEPPSWALWPSQYGIPTSGPAYFNAVSSGNTGDVGDHWTLIRTFQNGVIIAGHLGMRKNEIFNLTWLFPSLTFGQYRLLHTEKLGTWNNLLKIYQSGSTTGMDYLIFGAQSGGPGFYQNLIAVSIRVW